MSWRVGGEAERAIGAQGRGVVRADILASPRGAVAQLQPIGEVSDADQGQQSAEAAAVLGGIDAHHVHLTEVAVLHLQFE